jgi:hypothetical protein
MRAIKMHIERFIQTFVCAGCCAFMAAASGCISSPSDDPPPPSGGHQYVFDYDMFATEIDSILTDKGCDTVACHGGGIRGTYELSPNTDKDIDLDFAQSILQADGNDPPQSSLLIKPLAQSAGGAAHAGGESFADTGDPGYAAILAWIEAGESQ